jgi:hypothetical protein
MRVVHPGYRTQGVKKAPDSGSRIRIRNTGSHLSVPHAGANQSIFSFFVNGLVLTYNSASTN